MSIDVSESQPKKSRKVGLFVDTQNLYYSAKDYYSANINYELLLELARADRELSFATAYLVSKDDAVNPFVTKLNHLGYRVKKRQVVEHRRDDGSVLLDGDWDMGIAADMVRAFDRLDILVLASGDGDFVPMLELAQERGCRVEVLAIKDTCSQSLVECVDRFQDLSQIQGAFI